MGGRPLLGLLIVLVLDVAKFALLLLVGVDFSKRTLYFRVFLLGSKVLRSTGGGGKTGRGESIGAENCKQK